MCDASLCSLVELRLSHAQEARDSEPQTVGYSVSPLGDHMLSSAVGARSYIASNSGGGGSGSGVEATSGVLPMPHVTFGDGLGPLAAPPHAPTASEPYVSTPRVGCSRIHVFMQAAVLALLIALCHDLCT
jgi:hypothetical protein